MAMAFTDHVGAVELMRQRTGLEAAFLRTQTHGATEVGLFIAALHFTRRGAPFGDQADHWVGGVAVVLGRSEEHTSELQSLMRISYAVFCLKKKTSHNYTIHMTACAPK